MKFSFKHHVAALTAFAVLCSATIAAAEEKKDIVDTAVGAGSFKTLAAALGAADLVDALKGDGPYTVFAPTDKAFAKLPAGTVETLLKPENKDQLTAVLTYHVVAGQVAAKQVVDLEGVKTLNGQRVDISVDGGKVKVDNANVVTTDIYCSNGVIHVIDSVILPPEKKKVSALDVRKMIAAAIGRGAHTYNAGRHKACADIYMSTMREMVEYGDQMPEEIVASMKHVLTMAEHTHSATQQAWTLRHGLDHAYSRMARLQ